MRLTEDEARRRFSTGRVARLAMVDETGQPFLVVVTFAVSGSMVVTAVDQKPKTTRHLRRLRVIAANPRVSLLVDHYDEDWSTLWWVRADGTARILADDVAEPRALLVAKYSQYRDDPPTGPYIRIDVARWHGWAAAQ
ncbi:TIGR03668 family PPOX class F420-dependent oxidoreductase [Thermasporomyces composti]|uniref:PPOX class probable F420-dependent enzyme n=1 Tax=Thermasporomyces composti TaxID=696763 RepID=A0A3D9V095_THECX|nr:TIGR03668 family PPOX class F420-dependent oxidoreductase [Thermasporomyces composti]REF35178.1 PPOX class probable F420-dependent enzyme [Thermasporomyces composti]